MTSKPVDKPQQPVKARRVPQRMCVVCRTTAAKRTLTRVVRTAEDGVQVDRTGKRNGRGAYLCDQPMCWQRAIDTDILAKALRTTFTDADRACLTEARPIERLTAPIARHTED